MHKVLVLQFLSMLCKSTPVRLRTGVDLSFWGAAGRSQVCFLKRTSKINLMHMDC